MDNNVIASPSDELLVNRNIKDSVFRNLFSDKKYLFQLYQALHPEDKETTIDDLEYVTLENVLVRDIYNDLGVRIGDKLLLLIEAQSTWTENIIIRCLLYMARTLQDYLKSTSQSLFSEKLVHVPEPELYVIYTGDSVIEKEYISLSETFFEGKQTALDVRVKVVVDGKEGDIINQYVVFTKVINDQVKIYGRTREAITEAIRICKNRNILKDYLTSREKEVVDIMITLFDQQEVLEDYIASEVREQTEKKDKQTAKMLYDAGVPVETIANSLKRSIRIIEKWLGLVPQAY
ncbi:MAG: Rpn family recombination-promoting nuclease/putative transposase [Lachnospiraceae bacterium]|nr:Rpn family recombination-promoting nuclease/putative transposase [Lachnospiraceae bacterium]